MYEIIVVLKALTEIAGVAFLGQGVLWVIAGSKRDQNFVYKLFKTLTSPITLGALNIDNINSYTIAGAAQLTMDVSSGSASINVVNRGNHFISAPFVIADPTNVSVDAGSTLTFSSARHSDKSASVRS